MVKYYLAIDIGASSGRHMLGSLQKGKLKLEEIYRFSNSMTRKNGHLCWNIEQLFVEIINGLKKCKELEKIPSYMGIDTWAVDFVLLDEDNKLIGDAVGYRDSWTTGMDELVYEVIKPDELYHRTGIQKQIFNTIYQLMAVKTIYPDKLENAKSLLMIPEYLNFLLTGVKKSEYTNATTTQLVNIKTNDWDYDLIKLLGYPTKIFQPISKPGSVVGNFSQKVCDLVGFDCEVLLPATHDTASAVAAVPSNEDDTLYLSSGTWSLMGVERLVPDCSFASMEHNFTHEGGYDYRYRYLKNIMGLWMIQELKQELDDKYSFSELSEMARHEKIASIVDVQDSVFLSPKSMIQAIKDYCYEKEMVVPITPAEFAAVIYNSLAYCYAKTVKEIMEVTGKTYPAIHIIGGGANAQYLNQITANQTVLDVYAGPTEATAIGNIAVQMLATNEFYSLKSARKCIYESFEIKHYQPEDYL